MSHKQQIIAAFLSVIIVFSVSASAEAKKKIPVDSGIGLDNVKLSKKGNELRVKMDVLFSRVKVPANKAYVLVPVLVKGDNVEELPAIGLYSRGRFIQYERNGKRKLSAKETKTYSVKDMPQSILYEETVPFKLWMNGANLFLRQEEYGCRGCKVESSLGERIGGFNEYIFVPEYVYAHPQAETVKSRSVSGQAFVDFELGSSVVDERFHGNSKELAKIRATIDSVRKDKDVAVKLMVLKGSASPEGNFLTNEVLAEESTEAIKQYVKKFCKLDEKVFRTDHIAENWDGLREYVSKSSLPHRQEILDLIDNKYTYEDLDAKEWKLKSSYPEDYEILMRKCYPFLRRTDYEVDYTVRGYATPEELAEVLKTRPENLSLEELYVAAQACEPGSEEFNEIFFEAVRLYPDDKTANLNAAVSEMREGDFEGAKKYLDKAGSSGLSFYANGILSALKNDFKGAERWFIKAKSSGVAEAEGALEQLYSRNGRQGRK